MKTSRPACTRILAGSIAALLAATSARAADPDIFTWDGGADPNPSFGAAVNWLTDAAPNGNDVLHFAGTTNVSITNFDAYNGFRIFFDAGAGAFTLGGTGATLFDFTADNTNGTEYSAGANAPKIENSSANLQTINAPIVLNSGTVGFAEINPVNGGLLFGSTVDLAGTTQLRIYGNNGQTVTFNGAISSSGNAGANTVAINENSNVVYAAVNTYLGDTFINAGRLQFAQGGLADGSILRVGDTTGAANAELSIIDADGGTTIASVLNVRAGSSGVKTISATNTSGTNTFSGNVSLDADASTMTALGGMLAFTGGFFDLKNQILTVDGAGATTIGNLLDDTVGTGSVVKVGTGTLTLSNAANSFMGGVTINGGTVSVAANAALGDGGGMLTLDGGTLNVTAAITSARQLSLGATLGSTVTTVTGASVWLGQLIGVGGFAKNGVGSLELGGSGANLHGGLVNVNQGTLFLNKSSGNAIGSGGVTITSNTTAGFGAANISLSASEQIDNTAPIALSAFNGVRAGFDLNNFTETVGAVTMSSATVGTATIALGATGKLILTQDLTLNNNRNATNTGREVLITGTGNYGTVGVGGTVDLGGGARTITVNSAFGTANSEATIEAVIENGSLVKAGTRMLRLGAVNTYGGSTTVTNGTIRPLVAGAIPTGSNLFVSAASAGTTATLDFNGLSFTPASLTLGGGGGANTVATGVGTLTVASDIVYDATNSPQTSTISGLVNFSATRIFNIADSAGTTTELLISANISGAGNGLTKTGGGVLALSGSNTFTGPILVTGGALAVRGANTVTGNVQLNGGTLQFDTGLADSAAFNSILGATANGIIVGAGGGTILVNSTGQIDRTLTGRGIAVNGPLTIEVTRNEAAVANQLRFAQGSLPSVFTGSGTITKNGDGRLTISSPGTVSPNFNGAWIINAGTVEGAGVALGDSSATNTVTINALTGGATQLANLSLANSLTQNFTLNGGAISTTGFDRTASGSLAVTANSFVFLNDFWRDTGPTTGSNDLFLTGVVSNIGNLTVSVNRPLYAFNNSRLVLQNAANTYSGAITVEKALGLESNSTTGVGSALGTASVTLAGARLILRDNGPGSNGTLSYGNNVAIVAPAGNGALTGNATIDVDRSSGANTGNTYQLGTLSIGAQQLDVMGANGFKVLFTGLTTLTGNPIFNTTTSSLTLAGGMSGTGFTFTKTGAGTLRILAPATYDGFTLTAGTLELPNLIPGAGRTLAIPLNTGYGTGFSASQADLLDRVTVDSEGVAALGADSTFNPDFTAFIAGPNGQRLRFGGTANATLTGTITPHTDNTVRLGGGGGTLTLASVNAVSGTANLDVNTSGTNTGTVTLAAANNFSGTTTIGGGMLLRAGSDASLGTGVTAIALDNGTLQLANGGSFAAFSTRTLSAGTGGASVDTDGNAITLGTAIAGAGVFSKTGTGTLVLTNTAGTFGGKVAVRGGTLSVSADTNLGAAAALTADRLTLAGGTLQATGSFTIPVNRGVTLGAGGGTIEVTGANLLLLSSAMVGANPFTKEGTGTLRITADPNNTGLYTINGGVLELQHSGATDANMVVNNTGTLRVLTANDLGDAYTVTVNNGGTLDVRGSDTIAQILGSGTVTNDNAAASITLTVNSGTNATFSGVIRNGVGAPTFTLGLLKSGANTVTLTGANTYTGATTMNQGRLAVEGQFGALGNTAITVGDNNGADESMTFGQVGDVWTTGSTVNRIGDTGTLTLNGRVPVTYTGPASGSTGFNEVLGAFTTSAAFNTLTLVAGTGAADVQFSPASLARNSAGTQLVRGNGLGTTGGSTRLVSASPGTVGGGGAAGSQTQSIVPWMLGDSSQTGIGQSFLAHDAVNGLRPLLNAEYDIALAGAQTSRNVSISGGETVVANTVVNALRVTGGITTIGAGTRATVRTGAVLFTSAGTIAGPGFVDFGLTDGIISNANSAQTTVNLGARLAGGGGLTYSSAGLITNVLNLSGDNTSLSGNLTINTGTVQLGSATALNAKYPMTVIPRIASVLQLNGNSVTIRNLQAAGGGGSYQNGAATPATLTTYLTAGQNVDTALANGGAGALSLILSGGTSTLTITADASATGTAEIRTGSMTLNGTNGTINDMTAVTIQGGATLRLTNTSTANNTNRVSNAAALMMNGGTLDFDNNASAAVISESIDGLTIGAGANAITVDKGNSVTNSSVLTFSSLVGRNAGATLNLASQNNGAAIFDLGTLGNSRLVFTTAPTLDDGIIGGWATIDSSANTREFVKHVADADTVTAGNQPSITALVSADYAATLSSGANPAQNVKITATPIALSAATQINSLNLAQATATTVDIGAPNTLRVESGGIIVSGAVSSTIFTNGTLTAGNGAAAGGDLVIHTLPTANSAVSWVNASDTVSLGNVVNGTPVVFGTAPGGLTGGVTYYVINSTATTFQVALSPGGALVAITSDGTTASMNRFYSSTVTSIISDNGANPVNLVKAGGGILVPSGANTYTGKTYINGGQLRVSADNNLGGGIGTFAADKLVLSSGGTLDVPTSFTLDANRGITLGGGNNVISIGSGTAGNGKTLTYNGAIASTGAGEGSIQFRANLIPTAGIDPGRISANLSSVNITGSFRTDAGTVTLNGVSNTIGRSLQIGMDGTGTLTYTGAGSSLTVGKGINDTLDVGFNSSNILNTVGTLNLSGLGQFTANVDQVRVGGGSAAFTGQGTLTLATNNDITAGTQIIIGLTASVGNAAVTSTLTFGSGINNIATRSLTVGGDKSKANATVAAGGTVNLTGFGANTTDLFVANYFNTGTAGITSTFDMTGGTLNASLNTLAVGQKTGGNNGGNTGIFTVAGAGNVITANAVVVGRVDGNNTAGTNATAGTVNFGGGTLSVSNDVSLGLWSNNTTGTPTATGTLNITGGNVTVGGNITTTSSVSANATLTLNGGILDMTAGTINVDTFNAQTGTLKNVAQLQSGDGLTAIALNKNTAGTLIVDGTNLHTAGTAVSAGVLRATSDAALGALSSGVTISNAAILQAGGAITSSRTFTLGAGGGQIDTNGSTVTLGAASTVTGNVAGTQTLTKTGLGTLTLAGAQTYATLNANGGVTNVNSALGTGTSTLNANATTNINASQTLAALTIAAGVEVTFGDGLPFTGGPEKFGAPALVPEPGSLGLLLVGALGLVSRRRRA